MLQLDLKNQKPTHAPAKPPANPTALNQYNSLNRKVRIKDLTRIVDDNRNILKRLQSAKSHYQTDKWEDDFQKKKELGQRI
jgi:hypothetical protein